MYVGENGKCAVFLKKTLQKNIKPIIWRCCWLLKLNGTIKIENNVKQNFVKIKL